MPATLLILLSYLTDAGTYILTYQYLTDVSTSELHAVGAMVTHGTDLREARAPTEC